MCASIARLRRFVSWIALALATTAIPQTVTAGMNDAETEASPRHREAVAALEELGAEVSTLRTAEGRELLMVTTHATWAGGDDGLRYLRDLEGLRKLRLGGGITDAGLAYLAPLAELEALDLHLQGISDEGLRHLAGLEQLERLNLTYAPITDAGLDHLTGLTGLRWLGVVYTGVTAEGARRLQAALPGLEIQGSYIQSATETGGEPDDEIGTPPVARYKFQWGEPGTGKGAFRDPTDIAVFKDSHGRKLLVIADTGNDRIRHYTADGMFIDKWGESGDGEGQLRVPVGLAVDAGGDLLVADSANHRIVKTRIGARSFTELPGEPLGVLADGSDGLERPTDLAFDTEGGLLVLDRTKRKIRRLPADGTDLATWGDGIELNDPIALASASDGSVYVTDSGSAEVLRLTEEGGLAARWGGPGDGPGRFFSPAGLAVGPDGSVWVVDAGNHRVQKFDPAGRYLGELGGPGAGKGQLRRPWGIAIDTDGDLYITDAGNGRIQVFASAP